MVIREGALEKMVIDRSFWSGRKVFITGHTGFKGGWLSLWLQSLGAKVTGYSLPPQTDPNLFEIARIQEGMRSVIGDIRDVPQLRAEMTISEPELVIHMAAQALVRESYINPLETYATNVVGTANVLDIARGIPSIRGVVIITTDKCYENKEWDWGYREIDPLGGYDPYSSSKACAELVTAAYRQSFFNPLEYSRHRVAIASARAGNVIGGGDWSRDRLIPDLLMGFEQGKSVHIRNPEAIRPWQHVLEPLSGYLKLSEYLLKEDGISYADAWNFGPADSDARTVKWIAEEIIEKIGAHASWVRESEPQPHEAHYLKLDCSKSHSRLGWRPQWDLSKALSKIVDWQAQYSSGVDMRAFTLNQISEFENG